MPSNLKVIPAKPFTSLSHRALFTFCQRKLFNRSTWLRMLINLSLGKNIPIKSRKSLLIKSIFVSQTHQRELICSCTSLMTNPNVSSRFFSLRDLDLCRYQNRTCCRPTGFFTSSAECFQCFIHARTSCRPSLAAATKYLLQRWINSEPERFMREKFQSRWAALFLRLPRNSK